MKMKKFATSEEVVKAATGRWLDIFHAVSPALRPAVEVLASGSRRHVPCPVHGGRDGFRLFPDAAMTGGGVCNTCGTHQGIYLIAWAEDLDYLQAKDLVADLLGMLPNGSPVPKISATPRIVAAPPVISDVEVSRRTRKLRQYWVESVTVDDAKAEPLRLYLARRGLDARCLNPKVFRYHPAMPYYNKDGKKTGVHPCLLSLMQHCSGQSVTLHRTYLSQDGRKANVEDCRKACPYDEVNHSLSGSVVRLTPPGRVMAVGEGIETMLSVRLVTGMSTWAATTATLLANMEIPDEVEELYIWADKDRSKAGEFHAMKLKKRAWDEGKKARIVLPPGEVRLGDKSLDWNDVLIREGKSGFPTNPKVRLRVA